MPAMIGSTMRAAPSTMSSGGWKRCSALLRSAMCGRVLVAHPTGVDAVHVDAVGVVVGGRGAGHHVQRRLGHVRVRVAGGLEPSVELPLHRRHVDDVLVALGRAQHERLEASVQHERCHRVDQLRLEQLHRRHLGQRQPPRVAVAQVDLLQVLVESPFGEQAPAARRPPRAAGGLRQLGRVGDDRAPRRAAPAATSPDSRPDGEHVGAAQAFVRAEQARGRGRQRQPASRPRPPSCGGRSPAGDARSGRRC